MLILPGTAVVGSKVFGQTPTPTPTPMPDPLGKPSRYTLFPDHELLAFISSGAKDNDDGFTVATAIDQKTFAPDVNLNLNQISETTVPANTNIQSQAVAASGRILAPDEDQVVYARRSADTNANAAVEFLGYAGTSMVTLPGGLADRSAELIYAQADYLDIAAGDLDKVTDEVGNFHDEVVVAYASPPDANNQLAINLAVLDYTYHEANISAAPLYITTRQLEIGINSNSISANIYGGKLYSIESILKVAIGDLDGDGQNEMR